MSIKLKKCYKGPFIIDQVLPGDVYRIEQLRESRSSQKRHFVTIANVCQLKFWISGDEGETDKKDYPVNQSVERKSTMKKPSCT